MSDEWAMANCKLSLKSSPFSSPFAVEEFAGEMDCAAAMLLQATRAHKEYEDSISVTVRRRRVAGVTVRAYGASSNSGFVYKNRLPSSRHERMLSFTWSDALCAGDVNSMRSTKETPRPRRKVVER